jgi:hypothetical protein
MDLHQLRVATQSFRHPFPGGLQRLEALLDRALDPGRTVQFGRPGTPLQGLLLVACDQLGALQVRDQLQQGGPVLQRFAGGPQHAQDMGVARRLPAQREKGCQRLLPLAPGDLQLRLGDAHRQGRPRRRIEGALEEPVPVLQVPLFVRRPGRSQMIDQRRIDPLRGPLQDPAGAWEIPLGEGQQTARGLPLGASVEPAPVPGAQPAAGAEQDTRDHHQSAQDQQPRDRKQQGEPDAGLQRPVIPGDQDVARIAGDQRPDPARQQQGQDHAQQHPHHGAASARPRSR